MLAPLIAAGWLAWLRYCAQAELAAQATIEGAGYGQVIFDWQWDSARLTPISGAEPCWLRRKLGPGFFEEARAAAAVYGVDDSWMQYAAWLPGLESTFVGECMATDGGMAYVRKLRRLRSFWICQAPAVTARGWRNVSYLSRLQVLGFPLQADDRWLAPVDDLERLTDLVLARTRVTDAGMIHLRKLRALKYVNLDETGVTDDGVKRLAHLSRLRRLDLQGTRISDAALTTIGGFRNLEELHLDNTAVTYAGLRSLVPLKRCRVVSVAGTRVTPAGIAAMQARCPWMTFLR